MTKPVFDRSKFKATQSTTLKQADKEADATVRNRSVGADYIQIPAKDSKGTKMSGTHKIRIYPYHPDGGGNTFAETKVVHWLEVNVPERDEQGNIVNDPKTGKAQLKRVNKPIFNSKIHGGTEKDIIEEYIKYAEKLAKDNYPGDEAKQKAFLEPVYGSPFSTRSRKHNGIMARQSWVMYVDEIHKDGSKTFGRIDIGKAVKQRLNAIAASEAADEPLGTDPFTDIENGRAVNITYNAEAKKSQDYWTTELDTDFDRGTKQVILYPLSDEDLDKFMKYPSLASQFKNVYKLRDFELALSGLKILDEKEFEMEVAGKKEKFTIGCFQYDDFLDICEEISRYYPKEGTAAESQEEEVVETDNDPIKAVDAISPFDEMDKEELKDWCRENKTGIIVTNKMSEEALRLKVKEWYQQNMAANATAEVIEEKTFAKREVKREAVNDLPWDDKGNDKPISSSTQSRIDNIRSRLKR